MLARSISGRLASIVVAFVYGVGLAACASEPPAASDTDQASVDEVSSALPLAAVNNASFAGLGAGFIGTNVGTGTVGGSVNVGTTVGAGPLGFNSTFGTGPINFGTSFDTGPIGFSNSTGGSTTISSGTGGLPVITHTCVGFGCP
jgi:hypothetical protein